MKNDEEQNRANSMKQRAGDALGKLISIYRPKLKEPNLQERDPNLQEPAIEENQYKLRLASSEQSLSKANLLIQKRFLWRGFSTTNLNLKKNPNRITLTIDTNKHTVGTVTLVLDSPLGLDVDETYKAEIDHLRAEGRKLAEITNFAMDGRGNNKTVMASIVHLTYIYARRIHGQTDFVIEVNPRHALYYKRMLGFKCCGPEKPCSWANAPSVLLCLDLDHMEKQIMKLGGSLPPPTGEKSLYPYFFPKQDEVGIISRLLRVVGE